MPDSTTPQPNEHRFRIAQAIGIVVLCAAAFAALNLSNAAPASGPVAATSTPQIAVTGASAVLIDLTTG